MKARSWSCALLAAVLLPQFLSAQEQRKFVPALGWDSAKQGSFVTSVAVDSQNNVWAGTEGKGLWRYDSRGKKWAQFTSKDGLGDDYIHALAVDKLGRVWAGHLNHGVSVWNGEKWKNYGLLDGPLGDRVFAIATCPTDGDVWIATDNGAARYSLAKDDWDYFTRAGGLPSNQIQAIAFKPNGDIIIGTQCDGLAMAAAKDDYKKWETTPVPARMPNVMTGEGLPSGLINDVAVATTAQSFMILVATPNGLARSMGDERKWWFGRGEDWQASVEGLYDPPDPVRQGDDGKSDQPPLTEDWVTCIRQDEKTKNVWLGHRVKGLEIRSAEKGDVLTRAGDDTDSYFVRAFCLPPKGPPLVAVCDINTGGLMTLDDSRADLAPGDEPPKTAPPLPGTPKPVDAATLTALTKQLGVFKNTLKPGQGVFLGDDWRTQGSWVGRYGTSFAMLCGLDAPGIYDLEKDFDVSVIIGPHNKNGLSAAEPYVANDSVDDVRSLYNPSTGHRVEAEFNDFSFNRETYPPEWEGPDLWVDVKVPAGIHCVSLYFTNNDEQTGTDDNKARNKLRDFDLQLLAWGEVKDAVQKSTPLARARVTDFRGGVYKQFVVAGPGRYYVRVGRNHSFCTKLQGVFIDRISDEAAERKPLPGFDTAEYLPASLDDKSASAIRDDALLSAANGLWDLLGKSFDKAGVAGLQFPLRVMAYRAVVAGHAPEGLLATWRWQMAIWTQEDRDAYDKAMAGAFKAWSEKNMPDDRDEN